MKIKKKRLLKQTAFDKTNLILIGVIFFVIVGIIGMVSFFDIIPTDPEPTDTPDVPPAAQDTNTPTPTTMPTATATRTIPTATPTSPPTSS